MNQENHTVVSKRPFMPTVSSESDESVYFQLYLQNCSTMSGTLNHYAAAPIR